MHMSVSWTLSSSVSIFLCRVGLELCYAVVSCRDSRLTWDMFSHHATAYEQVMRVSRFFEVLLMFVQWKRAK